MRTANRYSGSMFWAGLSSVTWAATALGQAIVPGAQNVAGVFLSPMDNPTLRGTIPIVAPEEAERDLNEGGTDHWWFHRFELFTLTGCGADNPFCVSTETRSSRGATNVWPELLAQFPGGSNMSVEMHGLRLGFSPASIKIQKNNHDGVATTVTTTTAQLSPDTLLVPVNVVVVLPSANIDAGMRSFMTNFLDTYYHEALFDDLWTPDVFRVTEPGGLINEVHGYWTNRAQASFFGATFTVPAPGPKGYMRPDDVFVQCGVQFRLASVVAIEETSVRNVHFYDPTPLDALCLGGSDITLKGIFGSWKTAAAAPTAQVYLGAFNQNALTVVMSFNVANPNCAQIANGLTDVPHHIVTLAASQQANFDSLTLSHEIGHALGMDHPSGNCTGNVMCASSINWTPHVPGCEKRNGSPLPNVPFNCTPVAEEVVSPVANCDLVRQGAQLLAVKSAVPVPMEPPPGGGGGGGGSSGGWQSSAGPSSLSFDTDLFTEGSASLKVAGQPYRTITSSTFRTADWFQISDTISVDVFIPSGQPNPNWKGALDLNMSIPGAGINNAFVGHIELTPLGTNIWHTVSFTLPQAVRVAISKDYAGASVSFAVNTPTNAPPLRIDNIRFTGDVADRTVFHRGPSSGGSSSPILSFESMADWSSSAATLRKEVSRTTSGNVALGVTSPGYSEVVSRNFTKSELPTVTGTVSVDVWIPPTQPNPYWIGAVQLYATCPASGIQNQYLGQKSLTGLFFGEFNTLQFPSLPNNVRLALQAPGKACSLKLALNVNAGSGEYILDNLAFR